MPFCSIRGKECFALLASSVFQHGHRVHVVEDRYTSVRQFESDPGLEEAFLCIDNVRLVDQYPEALLGGDLLARRRRVGTIAFFALPKNLV
jgi:hypothetical protein